jgi:hypothetical protein
MQTCFFLVVMRDGSSPRMLPRDPDSMESTLAAPASGMHVEPLLAAPICIMYAYGAFVRNCKRRDCKKTLACKFKVKQVRQYANLFFWWSCVMARHLGCCPVIPIPWSQRLRPLHQACTWSPCLRPLYVSCMHTEHLSETANERLHASSRHRR